MAIKREKEQAALKKYCESFVEKQNKIIANLIIVKGLIY